MLSATHTDSVVRTLTAGDIIIATATPKWDRLTIGNAAEVLQVSGGLPVWGGLIAGQIPALATSKITSGTFDDARISQSSVTQHQAALSIASTQVTGLGDLATASQVTHQNNSSASDVAQLVGDFNALLLAMSIAGVMA